MFNKTFSLDTIKNRVLELIYQTVDEFNEQYEDIALEKSPNTVLWGASSPLDSLKLVSFIIATEQKIEEDFGVAISAVANEKAMSERRSPLRSIQALADFISSILVELQKNE